MKSNVVVTLTLLRIIAVGVLLVALALACSLLNILFQAGPVESSLAQPHDLSPDSLLIPSLTLRLESSPQPLIERLAVPADALVLINGPIIDGTGAAPLYNNVLIIQDALIMALLPLTAADLRLEPQVIDVEGRMILPGIINSHVHKAPDPKIRHGYLIEGVTSVCDLGCSLENVDDFEREMTAQSQPAARGFRAGPIITVRGGYPSTFHGFDWHYIVSTPEEARKKVEFLITEKEVDVIKLALEPGRPGRPWPVLPADMVEAIVETAHAHDVLVRVHVRQAAMLETALTAGVDVIEHVPLPFCLEAEYDEFLAEDRLHLAHFPELMAQLERMADQGIILVPTLDIACSVICDSLELTLDDQQALMDFLLEIVRYFRAAGGVIALGDDYSHPEMPLAEMNTFLAVGLEPMEVIQAATQQAAYVCGQGDNLGTLEPGKLADIIVVEGNPLVDLEALDHVILVIKGGQIVYQAEES